MKLGQNFLVDRNILDVIERLAELGPEDVVLELGGGGGVLTGRLIERAGYVHVVELDSSLEAGLRELTASSDNARLYIADAVTLDYRQLAPPPTKLVANLPYSVAATVILKSIEELPSIATWVVMVQREVGERFAAAPGSAAYGAPSALAQLECDVKVLRPIARTVFRPVPNVDSVLLGLYRRGGQRATPATRRLIHDAFAHRRKALARSLALTEDDQPGIRERARQALTELGLAADARAEQLSAEQFTALAGKLYA